MTIKAKVVSKERQLAMAQGRVLSAGTSRPAAAKLRQSAQRSPSSSSTSSSDSDASDAPPAHSKPPATAQPKGHVDPLEDHAAYAKRMAKQEWLYATGQAGGVPVPPPKPSTTMASPVRKPPVAAVQDKPRTPPPQPASSQASAAPSTAKSAASTTTSALPIAGAAKPAAGQLSSPPKATAQPVVKPSSTETVKPPPTPPPAPLPSELVTDEEEKQHPGRREYLRMLELLERTDVPKAPQDEEDDTSTSPPPLPRPHGTSQRKGMTLAQLTRFHYNQMYQEWLDADSDFPFLAYDHWERAESMSVMEMAGGSIDPGEMHQLFRQKSTRDEPSNDPNLRFALCVNILEDLVVSDTFERKVNRFLHAHHKPFLSSMPARSKGEFQHGDHDVFVKYGEMMEREVLGALQRRVPKFDETEFFDMLFQTDSLEEDGGSPLSFALWEVILSFLKFESFCEMMDEYIAVHYGVTETRGDTKTRSIVGSLRRSPPPKSPVVEPSKQKSTAPVVPLPSAAKSKAVSTPSATTRARPAVGAVVPNAAIKR